jgi:hypothetical protein
MEKASEMCDESEERNVMNQGGESGINEQKKKEILGNSSPQNLLLKEKKLICGDHKL